MKKIFVPILLTLFVFKNTYSQQYFDFNLNKYHLYQNNELEVEFLYIFDGYEEQNFIVRPVVIRGNAEIYDSEKNTWVNHNDLWSNMPLLNKKMKIKANLVGKSTLSFEIQNTITAEIYKTSEKTIWGGNIYGNYLEKINNNVFSYNTEEIKTIPVVHSMHTSTTEEPKGLLAKMIKYIDEII